MDSPFHDPESLREPLEQILSDAQGGDESLLGHIRGHLLLMRDLFNELEHQMHHNVAHTEDIEDGDLCHAALHLQESARISGLLTAAMAALDAIESEHSLLPGADTSLGQALVAGVLADVADEEREHQVHHLNRCLGDGHG